MPAGTTTEPGLIWLDLKGETSVLRYIDTFRQRLGLDKGRFLHPDHDEERRLDQDEWARRKYVHAEQLKAMAAEIKRLTG